MATGVFAGHRKRENPFTVAFVEGGREAMAFVAEDEPIAFFEREIVETFCRFRAAEHHVVETRIVFREKFIPIFVDGKV